jgi:cytochrome P450
VTRPALWQQLRSDRSLVETVIEETLRYESPVRTAFGVVVLLVIPGLVAVAAEATAGRTQVFTN